MTNFIGQNIPLTEEAFNTNDLCNSYVRSAMTMMTNATCFGDVQLVFPHQATSAQLIALVIKVIASFDLI